MTSPRVAKLIHQQGAKQRAIAEARPVNPSVTTLGDRRRRDGLYKYETEATDGQIGGVEKLTNAVANPAAPVQRLDDGRAPGSPGGTLATGKVADEVEEEIAELLSVNRCSGYLYNGQIWTCEEQEEEGVDFYVYPDFGTAEVRLLTLRGSGYRLSRYSLDAPPISAFDSDLLMEGDLFSRNKGRSAAELSSGATAIRLIAGGFLGIAGTTLYFSPDGRTWEESYSWNPPGIGLEIGGIAYNRPTRTIVVFGRGLTLTEFRILALTSTDNGATWQEIEIASRDPAIATKDWFLACLLGRSPIWILMDRINLEVEPDLIYFSTDGTDWDNVLNPLPRSASNSFLIPGKKAFLWLSENPNSSTELVWAYRSLDGRTWENVNPPPPAEYETAIVPGSNPIFRAAHNAAADTWLLSRTDNLISGATGKLLWRSRNAKIWQPLREPVTAIIANKGIGE